MPGEREKVGINAEARQKILDQQIIDWPKHLQGAKGGNPFATLCLHCYGRHAPPLDNICPHDPPSHDPKSERLDKSHV